MLHLQRWIQVAWSLASTFLVYSSFTHRAPAPFPIAALLWGLVVVGTILLFVHRPAGLAVSATAASSFLLETDDG